MDLKRFEPVAADQQIPIADFFRPANISNVTINEGGTKIAAVTAEAGDKTVLMVKDVASWEHKTMRGIEDKDVYQYEWLTDDRIMFNVSKDKRFAHSILVAHLKPKRTKMYYIFYFGMSQIIGVPEKNPLQPIVRGWGANAGRGDMGAVVLDAKLNVDRGNALITETINSEWDRARHINESHIIKRFPDVPEIAQNRVVFQADRRGELKYAYHVEDGIAHLHYLEGNEWVASPLDLETYEAKTVSDNDGHILVTEDMVTGHSPRIFEADVVTGKIGEMIFQDENYSVTGSFYRDRESRNIVGINYDRAGPKSVWFDEKYQKLQKALNGFFPKKVVRIESGNDDANRFVVRAYTDRQPASYHLVDLKKKKITDIASSRPWIDPERMSGMHIIQFKTAEGIKLDAYLTLPQGANKENPAPMVVLPHGGPWARDYWGWDREAQFLASRGYAVLQPNYRGSLGTDWRFPYNDRWEFVKMHDDVTRATKTVLRTGYIDPKRVAIMGWSFGGYLSLMGATEEPDLYQCAIPLAGVYDWGELYRQDKRLKNYRTRHQVLLLRMGSPDQYPEKYEAMSPGRRVDQIQVPIFVGHGKDDSNVSVGEAKRLIGDLNKHGKEYETMLIPQEGHGTARLENTVALYSRIEDFLAKHL